MPVGRPWKKTETKLLISYRTRKPPLKFKEIAQKLNRTRDACTIKARELGLSKPIQNRYTTEDDWFIWYHMHIKQLNYREIAEIMGRGKKSVANRATRKGLYYHPPGGEVPSEYQAIIKTETGSFFMNPTTKIHPPKMGSLTNKYRSL